VVTGTHTGEYNLFGVKIAPTGKKVTMSAVCIWRMTNGQLIEGWEVDDYLELANQIGVIEYTEKGKEFFSVLHP